LNAQLSKQKYDRSDSDSLQPFLVKTVFFTFGVSGETNVEAAQMNSGSLGMSSCVPVVVSMKICSPSDQILNACLSHS